MTQDSTARTEKYLESSAASGLKQRAVTEDSFERRNLNEFSMDAAKQAKSDSVIELAHLIGEETKVEQLLPSKPKEKKKEPQHEMKSISKLAGLKRTYNMYQSANSLVYSFGKRPFSTLEKLSEKIK